MEEERESCRTKPRALCAPHGWTGLELVLGGGVQGRIWLMGWALSPWRSHLPLVGVGASTVVSPGEDSRLCKHRDHISHLHVEEKEVLWLVFGPGWRRSESTWSFCTLVLMERELGCSGCYPSPGSPCKCKQSPKCEDQHPCRHICTPRWEIHPLLHSIVSSSLLGLG